MSESTVMPFTTSNVVTALLGLHAQTGLHPGSGTALGTVDLPVQRERHTLWPTIPGSALKGILRDACREHVKGRYTDDGEQVEPSRRRRRREIANETDPDLVSAFGPSNQRAEEHAGALSCTDARLLAFPVRSLRGVFAWVSCRAVLERLIRDLSLAGAAPTTDWVIPAVGKNQVALPVDDCPCVVGDTNVILEEFSFAKCGRADSTIATWIASNLLPELASFDATRTRFQRSFLLIGDDEFTHFARYATEVTARIALDYETKTVKDRALFYQEFLPAETVLYAVVLANNARSRAAAGKTAQQVFDFVEGALPSVVQIGGDETIGKGYCFTRLSRLGGA